MVGNRFYTAALAFIVLTYCTLVAGKPPATAPATTPANEAVDEPLPPGVIRRFGDLRFAGSGSVTQCSGCFSPDGQSFAACQLSIGIWDVHTGRQVCSIANPGLFGAVAFLNDDRLFAVSWAGATSRCYIFNVKTGAELKTIPLDTRTTPNALLVMPDHHTVALSIFGAGVKLLDIDTAKTKDLTDTNSGLPKGNSLLNGKWIVVSPLLQLSRDGKTLMVVTPDGQARFFDPVTGKPTDARRFDAPHGATWSGDGKTLAVATRTLDLIDAVTGKPLKPAPQAASDPNAASPATKPAASPAMDFMLFGPRDQLLAICEPSPEAAVSIWDTTHIPMKLVRRIPVSLPRPEHILWSPAGDTIAVFGGVHRVQILEVSTGRPLVEPSTHYGRIVAMDVAPDGKDLITGDEAGSLARWEIATGNRLAFRDGAGAEAAGAGDGSIAFADHGQALCVADKSGTVNICDPTTLATRRRFANGNAYCISRFSSDGQVALQYVGLRQLRLWSLETGRDITRHELKDVTGGVQIALTPDAGQVIQANMGERSIWNVADNTTLKIESENRRMVNAVSVSPDGRYALCGDIICLDTVTNAGQPVLRPLEDDRWAFRHGAAFDPLSGLLATFYQSAGNNNADGSHAPDAVVFEVATGKPIFSLQRSADQITQLRFVPHHSMLIAGLSDGTAILWDFLPSLREQKPDEPEADLWDDLTNPNPMIAFAAGVALLDQHKLLAHTRKLKPVVNRQANAAQLRQWVGQLSSPDASVKERAHKSLEGVGNAAAPFVRDALLKHPGGETEARLNDLLRLESVDSTPPDQPSDADKLRTRRAIQVLDWCSDPDAVAECSRLSGSALAPAATQPAR